MHRHANSIEHIIALFVILALVLAGAAYAINFGIMRDAAPGGPEAWGQFGDYLGGLINPIVGIATVFLVVRTLRVTREESNQTRTEMQRQLNHFQKQQELEDLPKRLDGVLAAWNAAMDLPAIIFMRGDPDTGATRINASNQTYRAHLYHPRIVNEMSAVARGAEAHDARVWWNGNLEHFLHLLDELHAYCLDYEHRTESRDLTDYYRHRVQWPLRAFKAIQIVGLPVSEGLSVSLTFRDYVQN